MLRKIRSVSDPLQNVKVGLEAAGHYHLNQLGYLLDQGLPTHVTNPLHTNLFQKSLGLRKTKPDKVDARVIAMLLLSDQSLKLYSIKLSRNDEQKSLTRYSTDKNRERAKSKALLTRLVVILFPELEKLVPNLNMASVYTILREFPGASFIASVHMTRLANLITASSKGRYEKDQAVEIKDAARQSVGQMMASKSLGTSTHHRSH